MPKPLFYGKCYYQCRTNFDTLTHYIHNNLVFCTVPSTQYTPCVLQGAWVSAADADTDSAVVRHVAIGRIADCIQLTTEGKNALKYIAKYITD